MALETRVKKREQSLRPPGEVIVVTIYTGTDGVGRSAEGCESDGEAMTRIPPRGPHDAVILIHAYACANAGTPHSHADDEVKRWPLRRSRAIPPQPSPRTCSVPPQRCGGRSRATCCRQSVPPEQSHVQPFRR